MWTYIISAIVALGLLAGIITWADRNIETTAGVRKGEAKTQAKWDAANEKARKSSAAKDEENRIAKEKADASNAKTKRDLAGLYTAYRSLRDQPRHGSLLPETPSGSTTPARASFNRESLDTALSGFDRGVTGLLEEGDRAIVDLDSAKEWAQKR